MAKFQVIAAAVDRHSYALAIVAMLAAVIAAYLYLRVIVAMFLTDDAGDATRGIRVPVFAGVTLAVSLGFTVFAGVLPSPLLDVARHAVPVLAPIR
jgi:NADH-quinone oxidoreductase subunit N